MDDNQSLNLIIIGTGAYVCGKENDEYGTILPAILTYAEKFKEKINLLFVCNSEKGKQNVLKKCEKLIKLTNAGNLISFEFYMSFGDPKIFFQKYKSSESKVASIVSIPDNFHFRWISAMLEERIATLTVKPLTLNFSEGKELFKLSDNLNVPLFVEFHKRYDRQLRFARDSFNQGKIGIPLYSFTEYTQKKDIPLKAFNNWCQKTNIFCYLGVHYVDAMHYVTNAIPLKVSANGQKIFLKNEGLNTFDSVQASILWQDNNNNLFNQAIFSSWVESNLASAMSKQNFNLIGTKGRVDCEQKERGLKLLTDFSHTEDINPDFTRMYKKKDFFEFEGYGIDSIINFIHYIKKSDFCIADRRLCSAKEALISTAVIDAATKSLEDFSEWKDVAKID